MVYGAGIETLRREMQSTGYLTAFNDIKDMKKRFFEAYPAIRDYCCCVGNADYILLPTGSRWFLKEIKPYRRCAYIMQFVESLILRNTIILLKGYVKRGWLDLYLTIHDSIWIEMNACSYEDMREFIQQCFDKSADKILKKNKIQIKEECIYDVTGSY